MLRQDLLCFILFDELYTTNLHRMHVSDQQHDSKSLAVLGELTNIQLDAMRHSHVVSKRTSISFELLCIIIVPNLVPHP